MPIYYKYRCEAFSTDEYKFWTIATSRTKNKDKKIKNGLIAERALLALEKFKEKYRQ